TGGVPPYTLLAGWTAPSGSTLSLSTATITDTGACDTEANGQSYSGTVQDSEGAQASFSGTVDVAAAAVEYLWDSSDKSAKITISGAGLIITHTGADGYASAISDTALPATGKVYWEYNIIEASSNSFIRVGIAPARPADASYVGTALHSAGFNQGD